MSHSTQNRNDYVYSSDVSATPASVKYRPKSKYEAKVLVWICTSEEGVSTPIFIECGNAVDQFTYLKFKDEKFIPKIEIIGSKKQKVKIFSYNGYIIIDHVFPKIKLSMNKKSAMIINKTL